MRYINSSWVCDGLSDCTSGADESLTLCPVSTSRAPNNVVIDNNAFQCGEDEFECASGECIAANLVCDDIRHCNDGTDEGFTCCE